MDPKNTIKKHVIKSLDSERKIKIVYIAKKIYSIDWRNRRLEVLLWPQNKNYILDYIDFAVKTLDKHVDYDDIERVKKILTTKELYNVVELRQIKKLMKRTNVVKTFTLVYKDYCLSMFVSIKPTSSCSECLSAYYITPYGSVVDIVFVDHITRYRNSKLLLGVLNKALLYALVNELRYLFDIIFPNVQWL